MHNYISILTSECPGLTQDDPLALVAYASDLQGPSVRASPQKPVQVGRGLSARVGNFFKGTA